MNRYISEDVVEFQIDRNIAEMRDRIIVGVARRFGASCLTRDAEILASGIVSVVW
jgi:hypothetical protein